MTTGEIIGLSLALLVMLAGLIGCIMPAFPGTPLVLVAAVGHRLYFGQAGISNPVLIILIVLTLISVLFDFLAGMFGANKFGATWRGATGALLGGLIGLFFGLPGIILGPFVGATLGLFAGIVGKFSVAVVMILLFTTNVILRSAN